MSNPPSEAEMEQIARLVLLAEAAQVRQQRQRLARALPAKHTDNRAGRRAVKSKRAT